MSITAATAAMSDSEDERRFRLFDSYRTYMMVVARKRVGDRLVGQMSASDLVQEAILAAVEAECQGRGPKPTERDRRLWLGGILRNKINAALKREAILPRAANDMDLPGSDSAPPNKVLTIERDRRVLAALDRLSREDRELIAWMIDGVSRREVGERVGVSASYASQICKRALVRLREAYGEDGESSGQ